MNLSQRIRVSRGLPPDPSPEEVARAEARLAAMLDDAKNYRNGRAPLDGDDSIDDLRLPDGSWPPGMEHLEEQAQAQNREREAVLKEMRRQRAEMKAKAEAGEGKSPDAGRAGDPPEATAAGDDTSPS